MFKFNNNIKSKKNTIIPEYEEYLAIYSAQFINMTNEQLQEESKTINGSGLSIFQKLAKIHSLKSELEKRNQKKLLNIYINK